MLRNYSIYRESSALFRNSDWLGFWLKSKDIQLMLNPRKRLLGKNRAIHSSTSWLSRQHDGVRTQRSDFKPHTRQISINKFSKLNKNISIHFFVNEMVQASQNRLKCGLRLTKLVQQTGSGNFSRQEVETQMCSKTRHLQCPTLLEISVPTLWSLLSANLSFSSVR